MGQAPAVTARLASSALPYTALLSFFVAIPLLMPLLGFVLSSFMLEFWLAGAGLLRPATFYAVQPLLPCACLSPVPLLSVPAPRPFPFPPMSKHIGIVYPVVAGRNE